MFHDSMNVVSIPIAKVINELQERGTRASHVQPLERQTNADRAIRRKIQQTQIFILEIRLGGTRFRGSIYRPRSVTYRTLKYSRLRASFFFQNCPLFSCFLSFFKSFISIISYLFGTANNILNNTSGQLKYIARALWSFPRIYLSTISSSRFSKWPFAKILSKGQINSSPARVIRIGHASSTWQPIFPRRNCQIIIRGGGERGNRGLG